MSNPEFPSSRPESRQEKAPTLEEVLALLLPHIRGISGIEELEAELKRGLESGSARMLSDEKGLYLLEIPREGAAPGDIDEYRYMRARNPGTHTGIRESRMDVTYYVDGVPCGSDQLARFYPEEGAWK